MNLVPLSIDSIHFGQPLPFVLRGADGTLLAQKGFVIRNRDDLGQMRKYDPGFTGHQPRF